MAQPTTWDLVAPAYALEIVPAFEAFARDALALAAPPAGTRIVDVACGPGTLAVLAARAGHRVDALDFAPNMIALLDARARAESLAIATQIGDGQALPYPDATFAAAFSMFGVMFFPDRAKGLAELRRVLVPGGRVVVSSWLPLDHVPIMKAVFDVLRAHAGPAPGAPPPGPAELPLSSEALCRTELGAAFAEVTVARVSYAQHFASAREAWQSIARTLAPLVLLRRVVGEERWRVIDAAGLAAVERVNGPGATEIALHALLASGVAAT